MDDFSPEGVHARLSTSWKQRLIDSATNLATLSGFSGIVIAGLAVATGKHPFPNNVTDALTLVGVSTVACMVGLLVPSSVGSISSFVSVAKNRPRTADSIRLHQQIVNTRASN
jgi:hypothetical protein